MLYLMEYREKNIESQTRFLKQQKVVALKCKI